MSQHELLVLTGEGGCSVLFILLLVIFVSLDVQFFLYVRAVVHRDGRAQRSTVHPRNEVVRRRVQVSWTIAARVLKHAVVGFILVYQPT